MSKIPIDGKNRHSAIRFSSAERISALIDQLVNGVPFAAAAKAVGYVHVPAAYLEMRRPECIAELKAQLAHKLLLRGAPAAVQHLCDAIEGQKSDKVRVDACKAVLDRAGFIAPRQADDKPSRSPAEMSADELRTFLDAATAELARRATPVDATVTRQSGSEAFDFLE